MALCGLLRSGVTLQPEVKNDHSSYSFHYCYYREQMHVGNLDDLLLYDFGERGYGAQSDFAFRRIPQNVFLRHPDLKTQHSRAPQNV